MTENILTIATSNMNGLRAAHRKEVSQWVERVMPDIWCLQETRAPQDAIDPIVADFAKIYAADGKNLLNQDEVCRIKGRAGVALMTPLPILDVRRGLPGLNEDVDTGRWLEADIKTPNGATLTVVCVYVHSGDIADPAKMEQKYRFLNAMTQRLRWFQDRASEENGVQTAVCGDFNIAHTPRDIKNAKPNETHSGFLPQERAYMDNWFNRIGLVDTMRTLAGPVQGPYTWWSQRGRAFDHDAGWRLDYQVDTPKLAAAARSFAIDKADSYASRWSDHAPLTISYDLQALR